MEIAFYQKRVAEKNPTSDNPEMTTLVDRIDRWTKISNGSRILDFGCYDGYILRRLRARKDITGVGVDIALDAVALARQLAGNDRLEFVVSDGMPLPLASGSFDVAVCSEILEHVPDHHAVLEEIARVLAPGGRLYATMPNTLRDVWWPFHPLCRRLDEVEGHLRRLSREEFVAAVSSHGFQPLRVRYRGFLLSAIWYRSLIYTPRVKALGLRLIGTETSAGQRLARFTAYAAMRTYIYGDRLFSRYRRCMGIDAAFVKNSRPASEDGVRVASR